MSKDKVTGGNASSLKKEKEVSGDPLHKGHITDYTDEQLIRYIDDEVDKWMDLNWNILPGTTNAGDIDYCAELKKIILYFYQRYKEVFGKNHPIISEMGYHKIVNEYMSPPDDLRNGEIWVLEDYKEMIDKYFTVDYGKYKSPGKKIELSLSHFMSKTIREHMAHQSGVL